MERFPWFPHSNSGVLWAGKIEVDRGAAAGGAALQRSLQPGPSGWAPLGPVGPRWAPLGPLGPVGPLAGSVGSVTSEDLSHGVARP